MIQTPGVDAELEEHLAALRTVRGAMRLFAALLAISLLIHVAFFCLARYGDLLDTTRAGSEAAAPAAPTTTSTAPATQPTFTSSWGERYRPQVLRAATLALPLGRLVGSASAVLLVITMLLATGVSLSGRLGGARSLIIGFFYALLAVVLLCPWQMWLPLEGIPVRGAFLRWPEVESAARADIATVGDQIGQAVRFFVLPGAVLLLLLGVALRFRRASTFALERIDPEVRARIS